MRTLVSLGLVASLAFVATADAAGPFRGKSAKSVLGAPIVGVYPGAPPAIAPSFAFRERSFQRLHVPGFNRFTTFAAPLAYVAPPVFYEPPAYFDPPVAYGPPAQVAVPVAPPPPPEREVIEYSDGRYELRGDGITVPYRWVWIPRAPPPPGSPRDARLYGWSDEKGELYVTDRLDAVPERYRAQAKRNQSS